MKQNNKILLEVVAIILFGLVLVFAPPDRPTVLGGVSSGQEYNATTSVSTSASASESYVALKSAGVFGSIIVNQPATAGYLRVWDATSTATSTYQTQDFSSATL